MIFQSTLPQGKWRPWCGQGCWYVDFNPHFRKGSDCRQPVEKGRSNTFQSTLPQGKWRIDVVSVFLKVKFQSTLPQGKWRHNYTVIYAIFIFQSTLPQGKWLTDFGKVVTLIDFNPHFRKGSDRLHNYKRTCYCISIHTSAREVTKCE